MNILIPTDFSENAWNAICYGVQFFKGQPINFYLLHVNLSDKFQGTNRRVENTSNIQNKLKETKEKIERLFPNNSHTLYTSLEHSVFIEGIKKSIAKRGIDFIVIGTKGASGLKEATLGSRTVEVITRVKCPTLVIPEKAKYVIPKQIVFPTDFNSYYKSKVLHTLTEIINVNEATMHVLYVIKKKRELSELQIENKTFLEGFLEDKLHNFHFMISQNLEEALSSFINNMEIDMIAMVAKNINFFQHLLFKSTAARVSYHIQTPFLVLHE